MKRWSVFSLLLILALAVTACAAPAAPTEPPTAVPTVAAPMDIVDTAVAAGSFTTLVAAVEAAGLVDALKGDGPFTVFAPTDEAFAALPKETLDALLADPEALAQILTYHVLAGKVMAADVSDGLSAPTLAGPAVTFTVVDGKPMINDANIIATDIEASNGVIHVIDKVIVPPAEGAAAPSDSATMDIVDTAVAAGSFTTLVAAVEAAGLVEALKGDGPFTVFAPTDEAFAALPKETLDALLADPEALAKILTYHVLAGQVMAADVTDGLSGPTVAGPDITFTIVDGKPMINDANIIATDILASNGVIHVIDKVILPPAEGAAAPKDDMVKDIVDTAVAAGSFNTLVAAVQAAGLVDALKGEGPFTVFAPTDEAFAALPKGTLDALLADPKALAEILTYHVLAGKVMAADVTDGLSAPTLAGPAVVFTIVDGKPMINDANIVATDVAASNGVIHVIDKVILPPAAGAAIPGDAMAKDILGTAKAAGSFTTLLAAVKAAGLEEALMGKGPFTVFAPTDEAFAKLPAGTLDALLADPKQLESILLYHVVSGKVMAKDVAKMGFVDTLLNRSLAVTASPNGDVRINGANVTTADIETSNGVIHVIDTVLVPAS